MGEIATIGLTVINGGDRYAIYKADDSGHELVKKSWFYSHHAMYGGFSGSLQYSNNRYYHTGWSIDTALNFKGVYTIWDKEFNLIVDKQIAVNDSNTLFLSSYAGLTTNIAVGYISVYIPAGQRHQRQLLLMQLDTTGNKIWERSYTAKPGLWHLQGNSVIATMDGGYAVGGGGAYAQIGKLTYAYVLVTDSIGNKINERYFMNDEYGNFVTHIQQKSNGNFLITYSKGYFSKDPQNWRERSYYIAVEELDKTTLQTVWQKEYAPGYINLRSVGRIIPQNDSTYLICGTYRPEEVLYQGEYAAQLGFIFAITENGDSLWYRDYLNGTDKWEHNYLNDIAITPDGGIVGAGRLETSNSPFTGGFASHVWLFKTDSIGCLYAGCDTVYEKPKPPVTEVKVYPNPAQGGQDLIIEIPNVTHATATLYNSIGQIVLKTKLTFFDSIAALSVSGGSLKGPFFLHLQTPDGKNYVEKVVFY